MQVSIVMPVEPVVISKLEKRISQKVVCQVTRIVPFVESKLPLMLLCHALIIKPLLVLLYAFLLSYLVGISSQINT